LAAALILYSVLAMGMPGLPVPMGMFIPSMMIGALAGRFLGEAFGNMELNVAHEGVYAMVGSAAMLAGFTHFTISIVVLLVEVSADLSIIVPLMLAIFIANICSKLISPHAFDEVMIHMKHVPFLDPDIPPEIKDKTAAHICRTLPDETLLPPQASMDEVKLALSYKDVECFPVLDGSSCIGTISRHHLELALHARDSSYQAVIEKTHSHEVIINTPKMFSTPTGAGRKVKIHLGDSETLERSGYALKSSYKLGVANRVRVVCRQEASDLLPGSSIPVAALMDAGPHILLDTMPVSRFYLMFTKMGARTVVVVTKRGEFCGTMSRADLIAAVHHEQLGHEHAEDEHGETPSNRRTSRAKPVTPRFRGGLLHKDKDADGGDKDPPPEGKPAGEPHGNVESEWSDINLGSDSHSAGGSTPLEKPPIPPPKEPPKQEVQDHTLKATPRGLPLVTNPVTPASEKSTTLYTKHGDADAHEEHQGHAGRERFFQQNGDAPHHAHKAPYEDGHPPEEIHCEDKMTTQVTPLKEVYHAEADDFGDAPDDHVDGDRHGHAEAASDEEAHDMDDGAHHHAVPLHAAHHSAQEGLDPEPEVIGSAHPEHQTEEAQSSRMVPQMVNHWDGFVATSGIHSVKATDNKPSESHDPQPHASASSEADPESHADETSCARALDTHGCLARSVAPEVMGSADAALRAESGSVDASLRAERAGTEGYVDVTGALWSADSPAQLARAPLHPRHASGVANTIGLLPRAFARGMANCGGMDQFCIERLPRHLSNVV